METEDNNQIPTTPPTTPVTTTVESSPTSVPLQLQPLDPIIPAAQPLAAEPAPPKDLTTPPLSLANPDAPTTAHVAPKKKTLSITIKDKAVLYAAYMPFLKNGGLFIPTKKTFAMGEECSLVIALLEEENRYSVNGRVVWITPMGSPTNKAGGIGIEFAENVDGETVRRKIEDMLGTLLQSDNATHTM